MSQALVRYYIVDVSQQVTQPVGIRYYIVDVSQPVGVRYYITSVRASTTLTLTVTPL
jgi:methyl coenzyme M reductase alpha subunit